MKVLVLSAPVDPPLYVERTGRLLALGRDPNADVSLPDPTVSLRHATLKRRGDQYLVTDEGSTNGTALAGPGGGEPVRLSPGSPRLVQDGDRLLLGAVSLELRFETPAAGSPSEDLPRDLVTASLSALGLSIEKEAIDAALAELTGLEDERMKDAPPPEAAVPIDAAGVVTGGRIRLLTDVAVAAAALLVLAVSGLLLKVFVLKQ